MPGLLQRSVQFINGSSTPCDAGSPSSNGIWSKQRDDITFDQLQKFWSQLPIQARQELLKIDKQTLFEQARKNLYCSRCNGLLLEGFSQIVMYAKSLHQEDAGLYYPNRTGPSKAQIDSDSDEVRDPLVHPWGGLAATRDGILTLLDCFINAKSLKALQNVFDNARARERERELLYPDACGGGGRGWISQGMASYGRGHGTRETCALHTARLSCDTLVGFWSALSDETRFSLLRMKEEDFIERLMYRFDSKRFCRDCRRNVIREFKELKELKRMRREPCCSSWFCVADTAFQYEVSEDTVHADWHQSFTDTVGTYHRFEWAIGTGEGKSDILDFEDVGMNGKVQVNGLDLGGLSACFITLRAWKLDGRCTELCVKAHALKGQPCVHRRLIVGDGFVTITKGESITRFFEHAEEAEEEEDDDSMDKDGNEYDGDGSRPQKHAKSPELAREFLLDAATVIFKEQVEKAFREGTARQNAHSIFVCLALKLLEERIHVACKEIITLEKQIKLLEEEEREKREEEERKERRRTKEREKKLRRKERLKGKERERERKHIESGSLHFVLPTSNNDSSSSTHDDSPNTPDSGDSVSELGDVAMISSPISPDSTNQQSYGFADANLKSGSIRHQCHVEGDLNSRDGNGSFILEQSKSSRRKLRFKKDSLLDQASKWYDKRHSVIRDDIRVQHDESDMKLIGHVMASSRCNNGVHRPPRERFVKANARNSYMKLSDKFHSPNGRTRDRYDFQSCSCNQQGDHRPKDGYHNPTIRSDREIMATNKTVDMPRSLYRSGKYNHGCCIPDNCVTPNGAPGRDAVHTKQVWEPMDARKKCTRSNSDPDIARRTAVKPVPSEEFGFDKDKTGCERPCSPLASTKDQCSSEFSENLCKPNASNSNKSDLGTLNGCHNGFTATRKSDCHSNKSDPGTLNVAEEEVDSHPIVSVLPTSNGCDPVVSSSGSDNCSSCLSEGDSSTSSSSAQNLESSSTSDSEDACQRSDGRYVPCEGNACHTFPDDASDSKTNGDASSTTRTPTVFPVASFTGSQLPSEESHANGRFGFDMPASQKHMLPMHNQSVHVPIFSSPAVGYQNQGVTAWSATPTNGFVPFPQPNHYMFSGPFGYAPPPNQSSEFRIQYNALQPLTTPVLSVQQHSLYETTKRVYVASPKEQVKNLNASGARQINGVSEPSGFVHPLERPPPNRKVPSKPPSAGKNGKTQNAAKPNDVIPSFSLFHFGGPMDAAAGYVANPVPLKEANTGEFVSKLPTPHANISCSKDGTVIEEYSLFAASNGARFSFF